MKSEMGVRHEDNEPTQTTNLIVHCSITDLSNQTTKLVRILDIIEKAFSLPLFCQWLEYLENIFQFPGGPCLSDPTPNVEGCRLTVPAPSFSCLPRHHLSKEVYRVKRRVL